MIRLVETELEAIIGYGNIPSCLLEGHSGVCIWIEINPEMQDYDDAYINVCINDAILQFKHDSHLHESVNYVETKREIKHHNEHVTVAVVSFRVKDIY